MTESTSRTYRVVALLSPGAKAPRSGPFVRIVRASSGYEAAAELLAEPASALLVDLARITPAHVGLLSLAGRRRVPVLAFGTVSAELGEALAHVRLVGEDQLAAALTKVLRGTPEVPSAQEAPAGPEAGPEAAGKAPPTPAPVPGKLTPAKSRFGQPISREEIDSLLLGDNP